MGGAIIQRFLAFRAAGEEVLQDRRYVTMAQAVKMLGVGAHREMDDDGGIGGIDRYIRSGDLRVVKVPLGRTAKKHVFLVEKTDIEALLRQWDNLLPLEVVRQSFLGVSNRCMRTLARAGLLTPTLGPSKAWLYRRAEVERFIAVAMEHSQRNTCASLDIVPLAHFRPVTTWTLENTLLAILNGSLKLTDTEAQQPLFQRLVLTRDEVNRFLEDKARQRRQSLGLFTVSEVAFELGVSAQIVLRWIDKGFIGAETLTIDKARSSLRISQKAVEIFHMTYVFSEEVAELLGVPVEKVRDYICKGTLHAVGGPNEKLLFLREEVESLRTSESLISESLTLKETATLLHISYPSVYYLVKSGKVPSFRPLNETKPIRVLRSDIEKFQRITKEEENGRSQEMGNKPGSKIL
jgi:predicted site-specific integrase-resolvase